MELKGINRAITKYALANNKYSIGITSLMNEMNLENISTPEDISFFIGPAINAAGRTADPHIALNLLLEKCPIKSQKIASQLLNLNNQRRTIEKQLLTEALLIINEKKLFNNNGICVFGSNWHEGIIGIIAGRIKDKFKKPAFVIAFNEDEIGKGSARSVSGINIGLFFNKAKSAGIILEGGGHALAGGFTIHKSKINEFCEFINSNIGNEFVNSIDIDHQISPMSNLSKISELLLQIEPFGKGIEKPLFCMERVRIKSSRKTTSGTHLMLSLAGELETGNIKAILFNINSKLDIVNAIEQNNGSLFDIAGFIDSNKQFGQSIIIEDIRLSIR
jgi:single-stranded-DNA-specific exonuclease